MALWGKTDTTNSVPKYLSDTDKENTYFVDETEAAVTANKAKGLGTGGWNLYTTYTDNTGATRHRAENLVAMGVSNAEAGDADDLAPAPVITIDTQPQAITVADGETATFTVTGSVTQGATITYQWAKDDQGDENFVDIAGATEASYTTGALTNADDDGTRYRVTLSATGAVEDIVSAQPAVTVTAP